jgi:DNA invertase Pin-like site-specific DNA recombinase
MMLTILAAVAQFERVRIGERIRDARAHMRRQGRHLGGSRPFGYRLVESKSSGKPVLVPDVAAQAAIERMRAMRHEGSTLFEIRDASRAVGFAISHEAVRQVLARKMEIDG